jgi:Zinc carboxypeptidase
MTFSKRLSRGFLASWKGKPLFTDKDGDGYPDHVDMPLVVSRDLKDPYVWAGVLNLVARIASEVIALQPPLVVARRALASSRPGFMILPPGRTLRSGRRTLFPAELWRPDGTTAYLSGSSGKAMMALLNALATSVGRANSILSEDWGFLRITAFSPLKIEVLDDKERFLGTCALPKETVGRKKINRAHPAPDLLNLAGPAGLYLTQAHNPRMRMLDAALHLGGHTLSAEVGLSLCDLVTRMVLEATQITLPMAFARKAEGPGVILKIRESTEKPVEIRLLRETRGLPQRIHAEGQPKAMARALRQWAQWAFLESGPGFEKSEAMRSRVSEFREFLHPSGPALSVPKPKEEPALNPLRFHARWKGEIHEVLELAHALPGGQGKLMGEVFVSKPLQLRRKLKAELQRLLRQKGYDPIINVRNAYKPGLSWLLEEILPELRKLSSLHALAFGYQPFVPAEKALEMKSRWLQELFPGPELVSRALGLDRGRVRISRRADQKTVYEIRALNSRGEILFQSGFSPVWTAFHYSSQEPELGFVHPTTGGIKLLHGSRGILDGKLPTDREVFWHLFQEKWLPLLEGHMSRRIKEESFHGESAFWEEIRLDVSIDETDERLSLGDERICPMEALHEDLYFVLLEAFSLFSKRHGLPDTLHFGRIVPRVLSKTKGALPSARLIAKPLGWGQMPGGRKGARSSSPVVSSLTFEKGAWGLEIKPPASDTLLATAGSRGFRVERSGENKLRLWVKAPKIKTTHWESPPLTSHTPPKNRLLKAGEVSRWIERLGRLECIDAWQASHSLQGRPLWALEAVLKKRGALTSLARMRLLKPTFLFNARHHANEVSSTNATLFMAWFLGTTRLGLDLLKHVNVAWIPLENPDGVATLEELLPYGRDHKLHAARYNALGVETYGEYFDDEPRFPEALAKARLWRRWLPEVMVDHHGVPSHEWDQPFSGYAPFRFREFWIPRNFVYACMPFVNEPGHPHHKTAVDLSTLLKKTMSGVPEIVRQNRELASRYRRYARGPEPATFPDSKGEPMLVLPPLGRTYRTNFAVRYPAVTRSEIILEVPDEGASGRRLELCVQAHLKTEEALLRAFRRTKGRTESVLDSKTGLLRLKWVPGKDLGP